MPSCLLPHRALTSVRGEDAEQFLEGLITSQLPDAGSAIGSALLTPQGKLFFTFLVSRDQSGFLLECDASEQSDLIKRLTLYKLRAKVEIAASDIPVAAGTDDGLVDLRHPDLWCRHYGSVAHADMPLDAYHSMRAAAGVLEGPDEVLANQDFPHDVALDLTGAVSFTKGCFVGQEVVSRVKHRGTARRRPVLIEGAGVSAGASLYVGERDIGSVRLAAEDKAVAVIRLDRIKDRSVQLGTPGGSTVAVAVPSYATYSLKVDEQID